MSDSACMLDTGGKSADGGRGAHSPRGEARVVVAGEHFCRRRGEEAHAAGERWLGAGVDSNVPPAFAALPDKEGQVLQPCSL